MEPNVIKEFNRALDLHYKKKKKLGVREKTTDWVLGNLKAIKRVEKKCGIRFLWGPGQIKIQS